MFNFFKYKDKITKIYQDLPPGERIKKLFEENIEPVLVNHDYKFIKSKFLFKRNIGEITQEIYIAKYPRNHGDETCSFWLIFSVIANTYNKWHKEKYGTLPMNNGVTGFYHNHLKNWKTEYKLDKYDLAKYDNKKVFSEIKENLENIILPLFEKFSSYEKSADTLMERKEYWWAAKIYDYYLIAGKPEKAKQALLAGKDYYDKKIDPQKEYFEAFQIRLKEI